MDKKNNDWIATMAEMFDSTYKPAVGARMTEQAICDICEDHKEEYHTTCCNTAYCHYCLDRLFEEATREVSHPAKCCARGTPIPVESVEALLSEDTTQRYKKAVAEFQVPTRERTYCVSCGSFVPVSNTLTHSAACTSCKNSTCTLCKQGSHEGECSSTTADSEFREVARKNGWQQCPHCGHMIALVEGCDHMTCICGRDFCYICGKNDCGYRCRRPANELQNLILEMRDLSEQFHDDFDVLYGLFENLTNGLNAARFSAPAEMYPDARRMAELGRTLERTRALPSEIRSHIELIHQAPVPAAMLHARTRQQSSPQEFLQQQQQQQQQRHQQQQQQRQQQQHQHRILQQMRQLQQERRVQQQLQQQIQEQLQERLLHEQSRGCGPFTESATAWQHSPYHPVQRPQNDPVSSAQHGFAWYDRRVAQEHLVSSPQYPATLASGPVMTSTPQTNEGNSVTLDSSENASFPYHPDTQSVWHNRQFFNQPLARHRGFHEQSSPAPRSPPGELLLPPMASLIPQSTGAHNTIPDKTDPNNKGPDDMVPHYMSSLNAMLLGTASDNMGSPATATQNLSSQGMATQSISEQSPVTPSLATESNLTLQAYEQQTAELTRDDRQSTQAKMGGKRKSDGGSNSGGRIRGRGPY